MILKGSTITTVQHARQFAAHLFKPENEVIRVRESIMGGEGQDAVAADLIDMQLLTSLTKGKTGIFHVAIDPRKEEAMTPTMWDRSLATDIPHSHLCI